MVLTRGALSKVPNYVELNTGGEVQVTAQVAQVEGVLQLQPRRGKDVSILAPGSSAGIPISAIDTLGDLNVGIVVAVEGSIIEVQPARSYNPARQAAMKSSSAVHARSASRPRTRT